MNIEPVEVIREMEQRFPKELTICVQAVQIRNLQEQLSDEPMTQIPDEPMTE